MNPNEWAGLIVSIATLVASFMAIVRWLVKHYLAELKPNSGSSMRDELTALKQDVSILKDLVIEMVGRK